MRPIRLATGVWINPLHVRKIVVVPPNSPLYLDRGIQVRSADRWGVRVMFNDATELDRIRNAEAVPFETQEQAEAYCSALADQVGGVAA
jgi:hypothetical protein